METWTKVTTFTYKGYFLLNKNATNATNKNAPNNIKVLDSIKHNTNLVDSCGAS